MPTTRPRSDRLARHPHRPTSTRIEIDGARYVIGQGGGHPSRRPVWRVDGHAPQCLGWVRVIDGRLEISPALRERLGAHAEAFVIATRARLGAAPDGGGNAKGAA